MNAIQQQNQALIDNFARQVQAGDESLSSVATMMGGGSLGQPWADAVKDRLAAWGVTASPAADVRRIVMQSKRAEQEAKAATFKELIAAGYEPYNPKQEVFTAVIRKQLDGCESGEYPKATKTAQAVVGDKSTKLLAKPAKKKLRRAFHENKEHPAMQLIHSVADNSAMVAAASGSLSNCLGTLTNSHKVARRLELIEQEQKRAQRIEKESQARIASLEARLDLKDSGKDWKEAARAILAAQPGISNRELARRVGKSDTAIRKYLTELVA